MWSLAGDTPGAAGVNDHGTPNSEKNTTAGDSMRTVPTRGDKPEFTDAPHGFDDIRAVRASPYF